MTVYAPMQMAKTPAPTCIVYEVAVTKAPLDDIEYSFEERRFALHQEIVL